MTAPPDEERGRANDPSILGFGGAWTISPYSTSIIAPIFGAQSSPIPADCQDVGDEQEVPPILRQHWFRCHG